MAMTQDEVRQKMAQYNWYHIIPIPEFGLMTPGLTNFHGGVQWNKAMTQESKVDLSGKDVLDIGARDCYFSLMAEQMGAKSITAIDNDVSRGAKEFLLPLLNSKIDYQFVPRLHEMVWKDAFDVILFFGVLYHVRYPFMALRKIVDACRVGGSILIEGGMLTDPQLQHMELLWCPDPGRSPYDPSSVTFFNERALDSAMHHMGCKKTFGMRRLNNSSPVDRGFLGYQKTTHRTYEAWDGGHTYHTRAAHSPSDWKATDVP